MLDTVFILFTHCPAFQNISPRRTGKRLSLPLQPRPVWATLFPPAGSRCASRVRHRKPCGAGGRSVAAVSLISLSCSLSLLFMTPLTGFQLQDAIGWSRASPLLSIRIDHQHFPPGALAGRMALGLFTNAPHQLFWGSLY